MKKIIILLVLLLMLQGCSSKEMFETSEGIMNETLNIALNIPFENYKNITASSGNLSSLMEKRFRLFSPYLTDDAKVSIKDEEVFWYMIYKVSSNQCDIVLDSVEYDLKDENLYDFKANVKVIFKNGRDTIDYLQTGTIGIFQEEEKWYVDSLSYSNDLAEVFE